MIYWAKHSLEIDVSPTNYFTSNRISVTSVQQQYMLQRDKPSTLDIHLLSPAFQQQYMLQRKLIRDKPSTEQSLHLPPLI